jgi:peptidoglycan/xylan/chitin deacetylase (PgdA/CDA1 family)
MLRPTLSRFHVLAIVALAGAAIALICEQRLVFWIIIFAFAVVTGLGVAIPQLSLFGAYICRGPGPQKRVALTFDDGPDARSTPALLELLEKSGVQAAFFCVGKRVAEQPELAARIVREGHLLENHSYTHSNLTNFFTVARLQEELARTQSLIQEKTGVAPRMFRPPIGLSNPRTFRAAHALGLTVVGWSIRSLDTKIADPKRVVARVTRRLAPGAIILLHDGNIPTERLVPTVQILLDRVRTLGYEVVRLDHLLT